MKLRKSLILFGVTVLASLCLTGIVGYVSHIESVNAQNSQVSSFNDGYATAMRDACQDHDVYACAWMAQNNGGK